MKIEFAKVIGRTPTSAEILVVGQEDSDFAVVTILREGNDFPDGRCVKTGRLIDGDWLIKLHEHLDDQCGELMEAEMDRICG